MRKIGVIGGSGLYELDGLEQVEQVDIVTTPFGPPSGHSMRGVFKGVEVIFIPRHGVGHQISPTHVNYRANIFELKRLGVEAIISVSACGSLREEMKPGDFVVPDQFVDRTNHARESSFFDDGIVAHIPFADPVSPELTDVLIACAKDVGATVHEKGTYINMEGPQFSTKAESNLYRSWGMDIIGMTNMVEAKLAREAEIAYASLCAVTDYDCWRESEEDVSVDMIMECLKKNTETAKDILRLAIPQVAKIPEFAAAHALKNAIVTNPHYISEQKRTELRILLEKYLA